MGRIPDETIEAIRNRVDIVDLVGRYVSLRQTGRSFKGLCPFHQEKTPSFHVHPERQIFHCFGCDEGGNVFVFLMKHENLSFPEAVAVAGAQCGIEIPETATEPRRGRSLPAPARGHRRGAERSTARSCVGPTVAGARAYLARRGIDDAAVAALRHRLRARLAGTRSCARSGAARIAGASSASAPGCSSSARAAAGTTTACAAA